MHIFSQGIFPEVKVGTDEEGAVEMSEFNGKFLNRINLLYE